MASYIRLVGLVTAFLPATAMAQSYNLTQTTRTFSSISSTGSPLSFSSSDDSYASISVPFDFPFFGSTVSTFDSLYANTNGALHINDLSSSYGNTAIPTPGTPDGFIAGMWDDLSVSTGGVYWAVQGSGSSRVLVVEYYNVSLLSSSETVSFQLRIAASGVIEIHYGTRSAPGAWSASVGVEDFTGSVGVGAFCTPSCSPADFPANTVLVFTPGAGPPPSSDLTIDYFDTLPGSVSVGDSASLYFEIRNAGTTASAPTSVALLAGLSPTPSVQDVPVAQTSIPAISAGGYYGDYLSFTVPPVPTGSYYMRLVVNPTQTAPETNYTNNFYEGGLVSVGGGGGTSITVLTTSLPQAQAGTPYSFQLQQTGASSPRWLILKGSLPSGLTLSSTGLISGTPLAATESGFVVECSQAGLTSGYGEFVLVVTGGNPTGLRITTTSLAPAQVGVPYTGQVEATGGVGQVAFQVIAGRPEWLLLSSEGRFSGTPTEVGTHSLTISVFDADFNDATAILNLEVRQPGQMSLATLPAGVVGRAYQAPLVQGGIPPYTVSVAEGAWPEGLSVDAQAVLSGTPVTEGTTNVGVVITDSASPQGRVEGSLSVNITGFVSLEIASGNVVIYTNTDADVAINATGGVAPYTWALVSGELLEGLTFSPDGHFRGRVTRVGMSTVVLSVTDAEGTSVQREVRVAAQVFQTSGGGGGGGRRRGGGCNAGSDFGLNLWALLPLALFLRRR